MEGVEIRMKTIVLPGYSIKNKYWAYEVESHMSKKYSVIVHEWEHWRESSGIPDETLVKVGLSNNQKLDHKLSLQMAKKLDVNYEVGIICTELGKFSKDENINIIAKSIGTKVAMTLVPVLKERLGKVILCGIPIDPLGYRKGLNIIGSGKLLVIQNSKDPFMPYSAIKTFMMLMDKNIKVVRKLSNTHDYPYYEDFAEFFGV